MARGWAVLAVIGAGVGMVAVIAVLVVRASDEDETEPVAVRGNSLVFIDPGDNRVVDAFALGGRPTRLAYGDGAFWAAVPEAGLVARVDEESRSVTRFRIGAEPYDVAVGGGAVWVPDHDLRRLLRVDPETGAVQQSQDFGAPAVSVGFGFEAVWVVVVPGVLVRVDPETLRVTRTTEDKAVNRIDRRERRVVASIKLGHNPIAVAAGASLVAVAVEESPF